jgi:APA family basic amino acid/polyamine antiporter
MYGISNIIGAGIFALAGIAVKYTGPSLFVSFGVAGMLCLITAMMYAELCARFPSNGSAFAYVYASFGELAAWVVGWNVLPFYGATVSGLARALVTYIVGLLAKFGINVPRYISCVEVFGIQDCNPLAALFTVLICLVNFQDT